MPRVAIPVIPVNARGGVVIGATAGVPVEKVGDPTNEHSISGNDGRVILHARNIAAGTINLTILPGVSIDGFTMPSRNVSRVNAGDLLIGPFPPSMFGETVNIDVDSANWRLRAYKLIGPPSLSPTPPVTPAAGARVNLPLTPITRAGVDITAGVGEVTGDVAADHYFANDGNVILLARATSIDTSYDVRPSFTMDGQTVADFAAPLFFANPIEMAGPYPTDLYNQPDGNVFINAASNTIRLRALWLRFQE